MIPVMQNVGQSSSIGMTGVDSLWYGVKVLRLTGGLQLVVLLVSSSSISPSSSSGRSIFLLFADCALKCFFRRRISSRSWLALAWSAAARPKAVSAQMSNSSKTKRLYSVHSEQCERRRWVSVWDSPWLVSKGGRTLRVVD